MNSETHNSALLEDFLDREHGPFVSTLALGCFVLIACCLIAGEAANKLWHLIPVRVRSGGKRAFIRRYCRLNKLDWNVGRRTHRVLKCDCGHEECEGYVMERKDPRWP